MLGVLLSVGAIPALVPIIIIIILIAAAAGLTRGTDLFAALGIGTLIGMGQGIGAGSTGKGLRKGYGSMAGGIGRRGYKKVGGALIPKSAQTAIKAKAKNLATMARAKTVSGSVSKSMGNASLTSLQTNYLTPSDVAGVHSPIDSYADRETANKDIMKKEYGRVRMSTKSKLSNKLGLGAAVALGGVPGYVGYRILTSKEKENRDNLKEFKKSNPKEYKQLIKKGKKDWMDYVKGRINEEKASKKGGGLSELRDIYQLLGKDLPSLVSGVPPSEKSGRILKQSGIVKTEGEKRGWYYDWEKKPGPAPKEPQRPVDGTWKEMREWKKKNKEWEEYQKKEKIKKNIEDYDSAKDFIIPQSAKDWTSLWFASYSAKGKEKWINKKLGVEPGKSKERSPPTGDKSQTENQE